MPILDFRLTKTFALTLVRDLDRPGGKIFGHLDEEFGHETSKSGQIILAVTKIAIFALLHLEVEKVCEVGNFRPGWILNTAMPENCYHTFWHITIIARIISMVDLQ